MLIKFLFNKKKKEETRMAEKRERMLMVVCHWTLLPSLIEVVREKLLETSPLLTELRNAFEGKRNVHGLIELSFSNNEEGRTQIRELQQALNRVIRDLTTLSIQLDHLTM